MKPILPGSTIGILGSGQLGRMLAIAARQMGYKIVVLSPDANTPAGQIADLEIVASYDDLSAIRKFAKKVDVVTLEFENVPAAAALATESIVPLRPGAEVLATTQHRLREKNFLRANGFPVTGFVEITSELPSGCSYPAILKTAGFGYDGKGQIKVASDDELRAAWDQLERQPCVLEAFVPFERELSVVAARGLDGHFVDYGVFENSHQNHILDLTTAPAVVTAKSAKDALAITRGIFEKLNIVGVACVELFLKSDGTVIVNEIAPRPHNSGHLTIDAATTSQFEQQLRAICGLPLGDPRFHAPAAMANLLGDLWQPNPPDWAALLQFPEIRLHLYGKDEARPGRKMGHITALGKSGVHAAGIVRAARAALQAQSVQVQPLVAPLPVEDIADDGMADVGAVDAELIRSASDGF
ncbi:5-(carboxyamino)imidazole ribonucleotide synthase [Bryobacter aggregatus]|uniref:5-(carboxyamino)imidazole ribonucleotide synthase n=1 Tax=Bryobacter aggregatus TaxID=360054 RepID=UPI0009B5AB80|nr:5-(carboxyamino)imidazole ribonucleotide synthase [Bryobacter aggregatus]